MGKYKTAVYKEWSLGVIHPYSEDSEDVIYEPLRTRCSHPPLRHFNDHTVHRLPKSELRDATVEDFDRIGVVYSEIYQVAESSQ